MALRISRKSIRILADRHPPHCIFRPGLYFAPTREAACSIFCCRICHVLSSVTTLAPRVTVSHGCYAYPSPLSGMVPAMPHLGHIWGDVILPCPHLTDFDIGVRSRFQSHLPPAHGKVTTMGIPDYHCDMVNEIWMG